jgi:F420-non-reducing hydrogenase iron-sulfur subunit
LLQKYTKQLGLEPERLKLEWISASEGKQFADLVNSYTETITEMGPSRIKEIMEIYN